MPVLSDVLSESLTLCDLPLALPVSSACASGPGPICHCSECSSARVGIWFAYVSPGWGDQVRRRLPGLLHCRQFPGTFKFRWGDYQDFKFTNSHWIRPAACLWDLSLPAGSYDPAGASVLRLGVLRAVQGTVLSAAAGATLGEGPQPERAASRRLRRAMCCELKLKLPTIGPGSVAHVP
jgi:hypothetical protein